MDRPHLVYQCDHTIVGKAVIELFIPEGVYVALYVVGGIYSALIVVAFLGIVWERIDGIRNRYIAIGD